MKLIHLISAFCFCCCALTALAQKSTSTLPFRFATKAEAQMLITDIDEYTNRWNQFDICARLQKPDGRKSELLRLGMNETRNWSDQEKEMITKVMNGLSEKLRKQKVSLQYPSEIILLKTSMKEEGNIPAYTRKNWIAVGEKALEKASAEELEQLMANEVFHILTRNNPEFRKAMYAVIGFKVAQHEILLPIDVQEKRISNPDFYTYDSYAPFTINGEKEECTMIIYTDRNYEGGELSQYLKVGLVPLDEALIPKQKDGKAIIYSIDQAEDFHTLVGQNTPYTTNPEEIMAENFALAITGKKDVPNPELLQKTMEALKNFK